ncbi:MAG: transposase [Alphaproteobacteria bacterium]|nr:transposase [Alphaproteobacteria bacterium]NCQ88731.1 transposase [Alphaproteobacteria bacterium]NCT08171.1 transposase [Alphaproteobacteria bacterium]
MARQARITLDYTPHHITQRGNRGEPVFFEKGDFQAYLDLLKEQCERFDIKIASYCLMPNQIHLLAVPKDSDLLARAIGETHRRYTNMINKRNEWRGHLFQDRFFSYVCDDEHSLRALRFIETMPVTSKIAPKPESYLWSSAKNRIKIINDPFLTPLPQFTNVHNWDEFLNRPMEAAELKDIQTHLQTGRPRGTDTFLDKLELKLGKKVRPQKRGRKARIAKKPKPEEPTGQSRQYIPYHIRVGA